LFVEALSKRTVSFPLKSEGVKVPSCLVLTEAVRLSVFDRHLTWLGAGETTGDHQGGTPRFHNFDNSLTTDSQINPALTAIWQPIDQNRPCQLKNSMPKITSSHYSNCG
jgi:hypothetical protein